MAWQGLLGHDAIMRRFQRAAERARLAGSFLFVGPHGIGKRTFAIALAKTLLCQHLTPDHFEPCDQCESCRLFPQADQLGIEPVTHPDFFAIAKPEDKSFLPLELLVGDKDHRGKAGLCFEISRTPYLGGKKVALIDDADFFNAEAANALLKTLEEPPTDSLLILLGSSAAKQLPTIRSRCQIVRFHPLSSKNIASILYQRGLVESLEQGLRVARQAEGSLETARDMLDDTLEGIRDELLRLFDAKRWDAVAVAAKVNTFVESAGKEAPLRRKRLRFLLGCIVDHLHGRLRQTDSHSEEKSRRAIRQIEHTLDALEQVDRNANLPFIVDALFNEL